MSTEHDLPREQAKPQAQRLTDEQALATTLCAPYLLVSASAGTGKTWTLVERVMDLIRGGAELERLLIITFTHKAADELKERLFDALNNDSNLRPLRLRLPQMNVSTIDAFCSRLLREHAVAAGVDPSFRVISEPDNLLALEEIMDDIFHHWYTRKDLTAQQMDEQKEFLRLVDLCRYRNGREELRNELLKLLVLARTTPDPEQFISNLKAGLEDSTPPYLRSYAKFLHRAWLQAVETYRRLLATAADQYGDKKTDKHKEALIVFESAPTPWNTSGEEGITPLTADLPGALESLRNHLLAGGLLDGESPWKLKLPRLPQRAPALKPYNEFVKHLIGGGGGPFSMIPGKPQVIGAQYSQTRQALETLIQLLTQIMVRYETYKSERGLLDFSDLELKTRELLLAPPAGLLERFDMVMVDEFQDVNRLQASIVESLQPSRGRFLVGDIKQCIYQFRLSDPSIFKDLFADATVTAPGDSSFDPADSSHIRLYMSQNFRSRKPVLELVNNVFATLFTEAMLGGDYQAEALRYYEAPEVGPDSGGTSPAEIHLFESGKAGTIGGINGTIYREASLVARRITELKAEKFPVYQKNLGWRPVQYSDMAIILRSPGPTGGPFAEILSAAGIPVDFGTQEFFARSEVRDFLCLLKVLDNAHDDIALAATLNSPATDFTVDDLLGLRLRWPESLSLYAGLKATALGVADAWSGEPAVAVHEKDDDPLSRKCLKFLNLLEDWRRRIQASDLPIAAAAILDESGLLEYATAAGGDSDPLGNLEQLITLARIYSQSRDHGLPGFIKYLTEMEAAGGGPASLRPPTGGIDAVRIISLHKSKGLEFPVVFLSMYGKKFNDQDTRNKLLTGENWIGIDIFNPQTYRITPTISHWTLAEERKRQIREEEMRVLYVALTRAREKLIITAHLPKSWDKLSADLELWKDSSGVPEALLHKVNRPIDWILGALTRAGLCDELPAVGSSLRPKDWLEFWHHESQTEASETAETTDSGTNPDNSDPQIAAALSADLNALAERFGKPYANSTATRWRGKFWVTEIKQLLDAQRHLDEYAEGSDLSFADTEFEPQPRRKRSGSPSAAGEGTWLHTLLEAVTTDATTGADILATARRLAKTGRLPSDWVSEDTIAPVVDFFASPLGIEMCAADTLDREANFSLKLAPSELARIWPDASELAPEEWILIQGQIDAIWRRSDGSWMVLDFKSDSVRNEKQLARRVDGYTPQLMLYREAAGRIWRADTVQCCLYFLRARKSITV
jgi:ATP-dependent helicase/nuclease subunit A